MKEKQPNEGVLAVTGSGGRFWGELNLRALRSCRSVVCSIRRGRGPGLYLIEISEGEETEL